MTDSEHNQRTIKFDELKGAINDLPETIKCLIHTEVNQAMAVCALEQIVTQIKGAFIAGTTELPFMPYIRHNIEKINSDKELVYIVELFNECWLIITPSYKVNTICKLSDEDALDATLSQYSGGDKVNDMELDKDPYLAAVNVSTIKKGSTDKPYAIYSLYLSDIKKILIPKLEINGYKFLDGPSFTLDRRIVTIDLSRAQIAKLSAYLINAGYICKNEEQAFQACFQNTLHAADHKIKWLGRNPRNKKLRSVASLYCLFESLGVDMADDNRRKQICKLFVDFEGNEIVYTDLKDRTGNGSGSSIQKKMSNDIKAIINEAN